MSKKRDSNPRPRPWQGRALPAELFLQAALRKIILFYKNLGYSPFDLRYLLSPQIVFMKQKVVIVESPGKIKTVQKYLGDDYAVVSSNGHVRDLPNSDFGVDIEHDFRPTYVVYPKKEKHLAFLKGFTDNAEVVYLASDDDREGEAIAWHTKEVLNIPDQKYQRIVFRSITKTAIEKALAEPRRLNTHLIDAQQARRILDRIVGYKLSPLLWKSISPKLSAGRVQSVAMRLIVERERAINAFVPKTQWRIKGIFKTDDNAECKAELPTTLGSYDEAKAFLHACQGAHFYVAELTQHTAKKPPQPPLKTSTMQQAAVELLGFSIDKTMVLAQKLYEKGKVTYIRTDSLYLSQESLAKAKRAILKQYGKGYHQERHFQTKSPNAQEAHEAILPTSFENEKASQDYDEQRLYTLIRIRALASQMTDATIDKTTATISISTCEQSMVAKGEVVIFKGFLAAFSKLPAYEQLPALRAKQRLQPLRIQAQEGKTKPPVRYTEASLVKKLEALGIGRPSTYRVIISAIQERGYVEKESREGIAESFRLLRLEGGLYTEIMSTKKVGSAKNKLFPTSVGMVVNDFLIAYFPEIMDYAFTASIEKKLDAVAHKKLLWKKMLHQFYPPFAKKLDEATAQKENKTFLMRLLGQDPATHMNVYARLSKRYGALVQLGEFEEERKPKFASLEKGQLLETVTLEEALKLLALPRYVGKWQGEHITAHSGRFGPYLRYKEGFFSLGKNHSPYSVTEPEAVEIIQEKTKRQSPIKTFEEDTSIQIMHGRFGPYIKSPQKNVKIPASQDPEALTFAECQALIEEALQKQKNKQRAGYKKKQAS